MADTGNLSSLFLGFAVLVIIVAVAGLIGSNVLNQVGTTSGNTSTPYKMVNTTVESMNQMSQWLPIIVVVLIGAFLVRLVMGSFGSYS